MTAAFPTPDSDQSKRPRQRWAGRLGITAVLLSLLLSGCLRTTLKPDETTAEQPVPPPEEPASETMGLTPAEDIDPQLAIAAEPTPAFPDIWRRLVSSFRLTEIVHPRIDHEIRRLQRSPNSFRALMARSEPYLHHIVERIEAAQLPGELALLPAVESGFRPHVYSPDGAAGLWQFMPATGRMLGLSQDWWFDKRRAIEPSTDAAIRYLGQLNRRFDGDWLHTLAAYNAGAGTVGRAIRRARKHQQSTAFWSLDLPGETDRYIPRLLAVAAIVRDPEAYGLDLPEIDNAPYFKAVDTEGQIDLNIAAQLAGIPTDALLAINAGHKRWASRPKGPHRLLVPVATASAFSAGLAQMPADKRLRWRRHPIVRGDSLNRIARQYGVTVQAIRESNGLRGSRIRTGDDLLIPLSESVSLATGGSNQQARQRLRYRVRKGDSLYKIARRFQVSIADLKRWNRVGRYIQPGERLTVFIDPDA